MVGWLQKWLQFSTPPHIQALDKVTFLLLPSRGDFVSPLWNLGWSGDCLWPHGEVVCASSKPRPHEAPCFYSLLEPGRGSWRMREHLEQNQSPS